MAFRLVVQPRMPAHVHPLDAVRDGAALVEKLERPLVRNTTWIVVLYRDERRAFDSRKVALDLKTERGARWLGQLVRTAIETDAFSPARPPIVWTDRAPDGCQCVHGALGARVEKRVTDDGFRVAVHQGDARVDLVDDRALAADVLVRTREAGRFLAELVLDLATAGLTIPHPREIAT